MAHVPKWFSLLIPRKSEYLVQELNFSSSLGVVLGIEAIDLILKNFPCCIRHVLDCIQFLLEFGLVRLLAVLQDSLIGVLKKISFGSFFEFVSHFLDIE